LKIQEKLAPTLLSVAEKVRDFAVRFIDNFDRICTVVWRVLVPVRALFNVLSMTINTIKRNADVLASFVAVMAMYKFMLWHATLTTKGLTIAMQLQHYWVKMVDYAQKMLNTTLLKNPYIVALVGVTMLIAGIISLRKRTKEATDEYAKLNKKAREYSSDEIAELDKIFYALRKTNPKSKERIELAKQLQDMYPDILKNMNLEKAGLDKINEVYSDIVKSIELTARVRANDEILKETYKAKDAFIDNNEKYLKEGVLIREKANDPFERDAAWYKLVWERSYKPLFDKLEGFEEKIEEHLQIGADLITGGSSSGSAGGTGGSGFDPTSISDLTSGGSKATNITINLGKLIENFNLKTETFSEGVDKAKDELIEGLLRVVNSTNRIAAQ